MKNVKVYTAIDLFEKVIDFIAMTPNSADWNNDVLKANPPRYIKFQQIEILMKVFLVQENENIISSETKQKSISIQSFLAGNFIKLKAIKEYSKAIKFINVYVDNNSNKFHLSNQIHLKELVFIFQRLLEFKKLLNKILCFNSGYLLADSISDIFTIELCNSISNKLHKESVDIDKILELIINPKGLSFTKKELISKFNYPSDNIIEIDYL